MRGVILAAMAAATPWLGGCSLMPPTQAQDFTVSGPATAGPADETQLVSAYCAGGYKKLGEVRLPSSGGGYTQWKIRCAPYKPMLTAGIPLPSLW